MKKCLAFSLLLFPLLLCASCLPFVGGPRGSGGAGSANPLEAAEAAYAQGRYRTAVSHYQAYFAGAPDSPRREAILASYGLAAERGALPDEAVMVYERLRREFPEGDFAREASARLPALYLTLGQAAKATELAASLWPAETDAGRRNDLRLVLAQGQYLGGQYREAADNFLYVWQRAGGAVRTAAQEGLSASLTRLDKPALENILQQNGQNFPGPEAGYLLIRGDIESGDNASAQSRAEYFARYFSAHPLMPAVSELTRLAAQPGRPLPAPAFGQNYDPRPTPAQYVEPPEGGAGGAGFGGLKGQVNVAALLPLSDESAARYAQETLAGLKLALAGRAPRGAGLGLLVLDTKGSPEEAARLIREIASREDVLAVAGPLLSQEAASAAQAAQEVKLPLVAVSQRPDLTRAGPYIFRVFLTPKHQAEAAARYAVRAQNHQSLGVLYPDDAYGRSMRDYFAAEAARHGGAVSVADGYNAKNQDWGEAISRMTGGKSARRVSTSYQAHTGFTALYMPDSAAPVAQILPLFAFYDVTRMQYLGSPLWLNRELLAGSARYLQGAVIPAPLTGLSQRAETAAFIAAFRAANGRDPDQFAAYGHDAGLAILSALERGAGTREEMRQALASASVPGAAAPFRFDQNGDYLAEPALVTVEGQDFKLLREAGGLQ
ncbi:MAG: penicillin-binding protein activator [Candidatus Adiutrix sp.]|jgi:branched-chain amino acid transport system substrate-binding protein|nr:penicillin-binding protein activator [Candidatus Adiutrix sp.]